MHINAIRKLLSAPQEEVRVKKIWQEIETKRYRYIDRGLATKTVFATCAVGIAILLAIVALNHSATPLLLDDDSPLPTLLGQGHSSKTVLSDGSTIALKKDARLEVLANSHTEVHFSLRRGFVLFDVVPNKERKWKIDCEGIEITVVGTSFSVNRNAHHVEVTVRRGAVLVKGEYVEGGIQRVGAGTSLTVPHAIKNVPKAAHARAPRKRTPTEPVDHGITPQDAKPHAPAVWRQHAKKGDYQKAYKALGTQGVSTLSRQSHRPGELLELADVARLGGNPQEAVLPLKKLIQNYPHNQKAGIASYTLARLYLEQLGNPGEAAVLFEHAISLNLPSAMIETAMARRVQAFMQINDERTQTAGKAYLLKYPNGRYKTRVEHWMTTTP